MPAKPKSAKGSKVASPRKKAPKAKKDIKIKYGDPRILLVAPHGVMGDDDRTDIVVREARKLLGCYAIVNDVFRRKSRNFNSYRSASKHPRFLKELMKAVHRPGFKLVVWIHGGDVGGDNWKNAIKAGGFGCPPEAIDAFIGYGQGYNPKNKEAEPDSNFTAKEETATAFRDYLTDAGMVSVITGKNSPSFKAREPDNMNQWLLKEGFPLDKGASIQIEIRKEGFRDTDENARKTASILSKALMKLVPAQPDEETADQVDVQKTDDMTKQPAVEILADDADTPFDPQETESADLPVRPRKSSPAAETGKPLDVANATDDELVEHAYDWLMGRYKKHVIDFTIEAGHRIVTLFYGGNYEDAHQKKKVRGAALLKLIEKLQSGPGNGPSKTWVYDAVNLAVDENRLSDFRTYGKIGHSQKVLLTHVSDLKTKKDLIKETAREKYSVASLRKRIKEVSPIPGGCVGVDNVPPDEGLEKLSRGRLDGLMAKLEQRIANYKEALDGYIADKGRVEKAIKRKN